MKSATQSYRVCKMVASCQVKDALSAMTMLFFGLVVLVNIGIRADSSQRDSTRSRAELNAVTYADLI